jgi:hypothetical protein
MICRPYATSPIALRVGPGKKDYYVASGLLQNPGWIDSAIWGKIRLPEVDEHTGHVLAHFLCTGTYQTLHDIEVSSEEETRVEFKRAFSAFVTAETYELAGLQRLAMQNIEQYGERMTIFDIVHAIDEDFSRLSDSTTDFQGYLKAKVGNEFQKNHNDFHNNGLFDRISNIALSKALAKCVMELYEDKITHMIQAERSIHGFPTKHDVMTEGDMNGEKKGNGDWDTGGVDSQSEKPKLGKGPATSKALGNDNGKNEEEATACDAAGTGGSGDSGGDKDGAGGDDWRNGWGSKKSKKQLKEWERWAKEKKEMLTEEAEEAERKKREDDTAAVAATAPPDDDWGAFASTKKKKKKGPKKESTPLPPPTPPEPEAILDHESILSPEPPADEWSDWGVPVATKKKKNKKGAAVVIPDPDPILEDCILADPLPSDPVPSLEPEPGPEPPVEENLIKSSKKKKKKLSEKDEAVEEQVSANSSKSPPEITARPESSEDKESSAKAAARICSDHVEHLFHGEGWKNCRICWAWLSQVTTQFTRARRADDDGYEIV